MEKSHGRLKQACQKLKISVVLLIPLGLSLLAGLWLGAESLKLNRSTEVTTHADEISAQSRLLVEQLRERIDEIRTQALALRTLGGPNPNGNPERQLPPSILHWVDYVADPKAPVIRQVLRGSAFRDRDWETQYLHSLGGRIDLSELRENGLLLMTVKGDPDRRIQSLGLGFPVAGAQGQSPQELVFVLINPAEAFPVFQRWISPQETGKRRAYLLWRDGSVLAHSLPTYVGTNFASTMVFTQGIRKLFEGGESGAAGGIVSGEFLSIDRLPVVASFARAGKLPLAVAVEESAPPAVSSLDHVIGFLLELPEQLSWVAMALVVMAWVTALVISRGRSRATESAKENEVQPVKPAVPLVTAPLVNRELPANREQELRPKASFTAEAAGSPAVIVQGRVIGGGASGSARGHVPGDELVFSDTRLRRELMAAQEALKSVKEENALVAQFEVESSRLKDARAVAERLTSLASRLCSSPVLYFNYNAGLRAAVLLADAGFPEGQAPVSLTFTIQDEVLGQIAAAAQAGRMCSLAHHEPLAKILLARIGVAHFEAWAVTGYGHLGRVSSRPRLLGVLVILQPGVESEIRKETISRMMRSTGLVYENALLTQ